jgi:hypothetical protein
LNLEGTDKIVSSLERDELYKFLKENPYEDFLEDAGILKAILIT